jgi:hypothetical protein
MRRCVRTSGPICLAAKVRYSGSAGLSGSGEHRVGNKSAFAAASIRVRAKPELNRVGNFLFVVFVASAINRPRRRCWPVGDSPGAEHGKGVVFAVVIVYPVFYQAEIFK